MDKKQAIAILKSIKRNCPFFKTEFSGGMQYGWDWNTFNAYYPKIVKTIKILLPIAKKGE